MGKTYLVYIDHVRCTRTTVTAETVKVEQLIHPEATLKEMATLLDMGYEIVYSGEKSLLKIKG